MTDENKKDLEYLNKIYGFDFTPYFRDDNKLFKEQEEFREFLVSSLETAMKEEGEEYEDLIKEIKEMDPDETEFLNKVEAYSKEFLSNEYDFDNYLADNGYVFLNGETIWHLKDWEKTSGEAKEDFELMGILFETLKEMPKEKTDNLISKMNESRGLYDWMWENVNDFVNRNPDVWHLLEYTKWNREYQEAKAIFKAIDEEFTPGFNDGINLDYEDLETTKDLSKKYDYSDKAVRDAFESAIEDFCGNLQHHWRPFIAKAAEGTIFENFTREEFKELGYDLSNSSNLEDGSLYIYNWLNEKLEEVEALSNLEDYDKVIKQKDFQINLLKSFKGFENCIELGDNDFEMSLFNDSDNPLSWLDIPNEVVVNKWVGVDKDVDLNSVQKIIIKDVFNNLTPEVIQEVYGVNKELSKGANKTLSESFLRGFQSDSANPCFDFDGKEGAINIGDEFYDYCNGVNVEKERFWKAYDLANFGDEIDTNLNLVGFDKDSKANAHIWYCFIDHNLIPANYDTIDWLDIDASNWIKPRVVEEIKSQPDFDGYIMNLGGENIKLDYRENMDFSHNADVNDFVKTILKLPESQNERKFWREWQEKYLDYGSINWNEVEKVENIRESLEKSKQAIEDEKIAMIKSVLDIKGEQSKER